MQSRIRFAINTVISVAISAVTVNYIRHLPVALVGSAAQNLHGAYMHAIEEAKCTGIPVMPQLLQAPLPPADQNAAPIYTQLTNLLDKYPLSKEDETTEWLTAPQDPSDRQFERVRRALANRADVMNLIHRAALRPQCVFVRDWSYPIAVHMPENSKMRTAARLLAAQCALLTHDGNPIGAITCIGGALRIARHVENDNYLMGYTSARTIDHDALRGLQKIIYIAGDKPGVADAVRSVIEKEWVQPDLARAFRSWAGATVVDLEVLRKLGPSSLNSFMSNIPSPGIHMTPQRWNEFIDDNGLVMLRLQCKEEAGAKLPYPQSFTALTAVDQEADRESSPSHLLVAVLTMPVADFAQRSAELQAHAHTTRATAALLAYKNRHGSFPATLDDAIKPVPLDPFDGKPLRYRREGQGFVVYSIGRNGICTGGNPSVRPSRYEVDVTFHYPMPEYDVKPPKEE